MIKKLSKIVIALIVLTSIITPISIYSEKVLEDVIKVGYVNVKGYEEGLAGEYKSGFGYEYLQKVSYYTNWKYEYVYGSFSELIDQLAKGEIDLLGNVTPTKEREKLMDFSEYPQGCESFYVYANVDDNRFTGNNPREFENMKIVVGKDTFQSKLMDEYFGKFDVKIKKVEVNATSGVIDAMKNHSVDACVLTDASDLGYVPIQNIGSNDFYFAINKRKHYLTDQLNAALNQIQSSDPYYNSTVSKKYNFGTTKNNYLTQNEKVWLKKHNNTIKMGYLTNNMPFSSTGNDGDVMGALSIVIDQLKDKFKIDVQIYPYKTVDLMRIDLANGIIDCIGPLYGDFYLSENNKELQSEPLSTTTPIALYKNELKTNRIAVSNRSVFDKDVIKVLFPEARVIQCDTVESCMKAISKGKADSMLVSSAQVNVLQKYSEMDHLNYTEIIKNADLCLFVNRGMTDVLTIINKSIALSSTELKGATFVEAVDGHSEITFQDFLSEYSIFLTFVAFVIIAILFTLVIKMHFADKRTKHAEKRAKEIADIKEQLEQKILIDPLTNLYTRNSFDEDLASIMDEKNIAILSIDINGLKEVNDKYGHDEGDKLLKCAADIIYTIFNTSGKCYHLSGDEFVVVVSNNIEIVRDNIKILKETCKLKKNKQFKLSMSVGLAIKEEHKDLSLFELYKYADQQMFKDKANYYKDKQINQRNSTIMETNYNNARMLPEHVPGGYIVFDKNTLELLYFNSKVLDLYEADSKEALVKYMQHNFKPMVSAKDFEQVMLTILQNSEASQIHYSITTCKHHQKHVTANYSCITKEDGTEVVYLLISEL